MAINYYIKKYLGVFVLTCLIFVTIISVSNYINTKKVAEIKTSEDKVSISILSLETQFELLQESTCAKLDRSTLSDEINSIGDKLSYAEANTEIDTKEVESLKKYYSLLEIKDYLLMKKVSKKCELNPIVIVYFYSNTNCTECQKQGYVLTYLREKYPQIRVYTFDYDLDLPAIKTLVAIHETKKVLPAVIVNEKVYNGYQSVEDLEKVLKPYLPRTSSKTE